MSVHIGEWVNHHLTPKCRIVEPSSTMTSDSYESVSVMADCADCVQEWLQDACTHCAGKGYIDSGCSEEGCCGNYPCNACGQEAAEDFIKQHAIKAGAKR